MNSVHAPVLTNFSQMICEEEIKKKKKKELKLQ